MARHGDPEIDRALEVVVSEINSLAERQDGGPGVVLTGGWPGHRRDDHS